MRASLYLLVISLVLLVSASACQQGAKALDAAAFYEKVSAQPHPLIVDVRTPGEFAGGFIAGAVNLSSNDPSFLQAVSQYPKTEPVYVYCLSGSRSARAAAAMRKAGFEEVYELQGGIMKWRAAKLPLISGTATKTASTAQADLASALASGKTVLIDFWAPWCGPCKAMSPFIEAVSKERDDVQVVRINADENEALVAQFRVEALPTLVVLKNQRVSWQHVGYLEKADILGGLAVNP